MSRLRTPEQENPNLYGLLHCTKGLSTLPELGNIAALSELHKQKELMTHHKKWPSSGSIHQQCSYNSYWNLFGHINQIEIGLYTKGAAALFLWAHFNVKICAIVYV